jgi:hypothetical protein
MNIIYENDLFYVAPAETLKGYKVVNKETGVTEFEHGFQWLCKSQADNLQMSLTAWNQHHPAGTNPPTRAVDTEAATLSTTEFWKKIVDDNKEANE